jgi:two-component system, OmpR family, sensor histidine kinase VicK
LPFNDLVEKMEVFYGTEKVISEELLFFSKARERIDTCMDSTRPSFAIGIESIKRSFVDARNRGVKLRYLTEITDANISYCKELMSIVDEVRHLDGIKGNFMISEIEYLAPATSHQETKLASLIIYSSVREIVEHQQYVFETLWNKSISAEKRIRELKDGITIHYQTKVIEDPDDVVKEISRLIVNSKEFNTCLTSGGMHYCHNYFLDARKELLEKQKKGDHNGVRYITNIDQDNLKFAKEFLDAGMRIRHVKNLPPMSFAVSDKEIVATIEKMDGGRMIQSLLLSNEPAYINHFQSIFEELWAKGIEAEDRIQDIEGGIEYADVEVIPLSSTARALYLNLVKKAEKEIIIMFPTTNAFIRQKNIGVIQFSEEAARERNVKVRILMPSHKSTEDTVLQLKENYDEHIDIRYIEKMSETKATIIVVDRKASLVMEIRDDSKQTFDEAIGLSTYSNSRSGVLSYVSIFENLWKETELYEQLKYQDKMQKEFINVAAHELRTPIQPILGLSQLLLSKTGSIEQYNELLSIINRNAKRLNRLSNDILDATKIESKSLELKKEQFNLNDIILPAIDDIMLDKEITSKNLQLLYEPHDIMLEADKSRIAEVISNLLSNAIKFTKKGTITISVEIDKTSKDDNKKWAIISVKDTGEGIDMNILPRLFTKFASSHGTGLGLFISKGIVEAHVGKIWGKNNVDGKGATFSFSLPLN